ncbi:hypothetical protein ALI144C_49835 [Actinosynnema sp. ALI-1.44]|nr:hypothetical protein ALI144C_49835 [Actinosynnema sp. ALI-1.44]
MKPSLTRLAAAIVVSAATMAGCTTATDGLPTPGSTQPTPNTGRATIPGGGNTGRPPTPTSKSTGNSPIRNADPCSLLTASDMAALSLLAGKTTDGSTDDDKGCRWHSSRQGDHTVQIDIYALLSIKDVQATGEVKQLGKVGKHQAVQYPFGTTCTISLAITDTSRVDVRVGAAGNHQKACEMAAQVAQMVEPELPGGS